MRQHQVDNGSSPIVYRYIDWLLTVPLQIAEFYLILAAIGVASVVMFRNLMLASAVMLVAGFFGETGAWDLFGDASTEIWWAIGMAGRIYIITRFSGVQSMTLPKRLAKCPVRIQLNARPCWLDGHLPTRLHDGQ